MEEDREHAAQSKGEKRPRTRDSHPRQVKKRKRGGKIEKCSLCVYRATSRHSLRLHYNMHHLPWFFAMTSACWLCRSQHGDSYKLEQHFRGSDVCTKLGGTYSYLVHHPILLPLMHTMLDHLARGLGLVDRTQLGRSEDHIPTLPPTAGLEKAEMDLIKLMTMPNEVSFKRPNHFSAFLHWRLFIHNLARVSPSVRNEIHRAPWCSAIPPEQSPFVKREVPPSFRGVLADSHCHLETCRKKKMRGVLKEDMPHGYLLDLIVSNYVYPEEWKSLIRRNFPTEDGRVYRSFGVHPSRAQFCSEKVFSTLEELLQLPRTVAIGEIGLDYSRDYSPEAQTAQRLLFARLLSLASKSNLPVIIHCRDAESDCLRMMKEKLSPLHRVHRHCFRGSKKDLDMWMRSFPNTVFGLTSKLPSAAVVRGIPRAQLVLETDSPYLADIPADVWHVAKAVAKIRGEPLELLSRVTACTTVRFYNCTPPRHPHA